MINSPQDIEDRLKYYWIKNYTTLTPLRLSPDFHNESVGGVVDLLITTDSIPSDVHTRYILSQESISNNDFTFLENISNYKLYRRRDLKNIAFVSFLEEDNACFFYRCKLPAWKLWEKYIDINCKILVKPQFIQSEIEIADLVVFHRYQENCYKLMEKIKLSGKRIIWDTDDAEMQVSPSHPMAMFYNRPIVKEQILKQIACVDVLTVATNALKKDYQLYFDRPIYVLRNKIDLKAKAWNLEKPTNPYCTIVFAGGQTHYEDLFEYSTAIINAVQKTDSYFILCGYSDKGVEFILDDKHNVVGARKTENKYWGKVVKMFDQLQNKMIVKEALGINAYPLFFQDADIVIAPLHDNKFSSFKSELKGVEAGGYSCAFMCSDREPYRVFQDEEECLKADSQSKFGKKLIRLVNDPILRNKISVNLRRKVEKNYDVNVQSDRYKIYSDLINRKE